MGLAMRQGALLGRNLAKALTGGEDFEPFTFKGLGSLAAIGHRTAVAEIMGVKFSGFFAWWMWRSVYLAKLPRIVKKLRVLVGWTFDLFFGRDIEQMITLRDVEELSERWVRIRARRAA